ncbi:LacI family transcriptional regulator [Sphingopyxis sp. PAMC25046]|uniref:LacI family DNA-binding transcriptional regulator n=1 Tax=Sphingopyxis sp. PAMC25046 TaxID=2565556 RepID=UPI00109E0355|nr:LacI family DNA-binding transcriptional regulator [Sphingopyxis sp. PAMC25046]QCB54192.1 LacI family transcriptional regulator [Sphingopyxis sp. PAMC25046]
MATLRDVAREAGVSVATASRAINGLGNVTAPTRAAVMAAVKKLNFVPHSGARSLTRRKTDTVGVILPDLFGEFFSEIIRGIDLVAHESGMHLLLGNMHGSTHETAAAIAAMRGRVDGLLVMPPDLKPELLADYLDPALPTVLLNYDAGSLDLPFVAVDNYRGAYAMTEALLAQGARQVVHIAGPKHNRDARDRQRGFVDAMAKIAKERSPVILPGDFSEESGEKAARLLVEGQLPADAVFAANDQMAVGLIAELARAGVSVPGDVMVAGFDDIPLARHLSPGLTTMQVNIDRLGSTGMMLLLRLLRGDALGAASATILNPNLIARGTTASSPDARRASTATGASPS